MATSNQKPVKTVTISYVDPAPGQSTQLEIINDPGGNVGEVQFNAKGGLFGGSNAFVWNNTTSNLGVRGNLSVTGNIYGNISASSTNLKIKGGVSGDVLVTDGTGNLTWTSLQDAGGYGNSEVANYLPTFEGELSAGNADLGNAVTANFFIGNGSLLTGLSTVAYTGNYNDLTNKPSIPEISKTFSVGSTVQVASLDVEPNEISLVATMDAGFGPNETTIGKVHVVAGTVNISSLDQDFPDVEYKSEINVSYYDGVTITNSPGPAEAKSWVFGNNGNLILPPGGDILRYDGEGNSSVLGGSSATNEITNTNGDPFQPSTYSVSVGTDGVVTMSTARGDIEFGAQPEPGGPTHLHIMRPTGQEGATDLYFGDDYNYVKMPASYGEGTQGVEIGSSYGQGTVSVWRFGTDGDLILPEGKTIRDNSGTDLLASNDTESGDPAYKGFKAHYGSMYGNNDDPNGPINKIVIYKDFGTPSSTIDTSTNNDTFTVTGLSDSDVVVMLVAIGENINQTPTAELKTFAEAIIDNVILAGGVEGQVNSAADMKTAFYNNFATFSATLTDLKANFEFFSVNNQFNLSPQFETGKGATFSGISYNISDDTLGLGSWGQNVGTHVVGDVFVIPGNTIQDANGNFLLTPDNDVTVTVTDAPSGYIGTVTVTGTLPRPQEIWPSNSINDGGSDEYDTGNYINTNLENNISYNDGNVVSSSSAFGGGDYVVTYRDSIFGVFAVNAVINSIATQGGSGFVGAGQGVTGSLYGATSEAGVDIGDFVFTGSTITATTTGGDLYIKAGDDLWLDALDDDIHIRANDDVRIKVGYNFQSDSAQNEWRFDNGGYISFPDGSTQATAWTGSVDYSNINNTPTLFSGDYDDLSNKPTSRIAVATGSGPGGNNQADSLALAGLNPVTDIPSTWGGDLILQGGVGGANGDLYGEVRIKSGTIGANYEWHFTTDKKLKLPAGGDIVDSTGASVLGGGSSFSGSYNDLTDKPTIPADVSDLTDTTNLLGGGGTTLPADASGYLNNNGSGTLTWVAGNPAGSGMLPYTDVVVFSNTVAGDWTSFTLSGTMDSFGDYNNSYATITLSSQTALGVQAVSNTKTLWINDSRVDSNNYMVIEFPPSPTVGDVFNITISAAQTTVNANSLVVGETYTILTTGNTNWTSIGAPYGGVGATFVATGTGSGTGTATTPAGAKKIIYKPASGQRVRTFPQGQTASLWFGTGGTHDFMYADMAVGNSGMLLTFVFAGAIDGTPSWYQVYF